MGDPKGQGPGSQAVQPKAVGPDAEPGHGEVGAGDRAPVGGREQ